MANVSLVARLSAQTLTFESAFKSASKITRAFEKDFEVTASTIQGQQDRINRAFANFSGDKMAREMAAIAAAVEKAGGVTRLTEAEQKKLNATVTEGLAKYKALGVEAPKSLHDLEAATRGLSQTTSLASKASAVLSSSFAQFTLANLAASAIQNVIGRVSEFIAQGAKLSGIERSFETLAGTVNQTAAGMLGSMRTATRGLVSDLDLMQSANKAVLLGLPVTEKEMGELATSATALGRAMGLDATQSLNDLITALGRSSPLILDNLGLTVKVGEANEEYARSLGKSVGALTDAEKKMAFYEAAMEAARKKTQELGEQTLTLGELVSRAWVAFGNDVTSTASFFNKTVGAMLTDGERLKTFFRSWQLGGLIVAFRDLNIEIDKLTKGIVERLPKGPKFGTASDAQEREDYVKSLKEIDQRLAKVSAEQKTQIAAAKALGVEYKAGAGHIHLTEKELARLESTTKAAVKETKDAAKEMKSFAQAADDLATRVDKNAQNAQKMALAFDKIQLSLNQMGLKIATDQLAIQMRQLDATTQAWLAYYKATSAVTGLEGMLGDKPRDIKDTGFDLGKGGINLIPERLVDPFRAAFTAFGQELPQIIFGTLQGGGSIVGAVAAGLAVAFGRQFEKELAKVGGQLSQLGGKGKLLGTAGVGLSSFVGGFGIGESTGSKAKGALGGAAAGALAGLPLAGPTLGLSVAVGALAGALGGLFGASKKAKEELQKLRQAQVDLIQEFGGLDKLKKTADDVGISIGNALTTKKGPEFERFVTKLNDLLKAQAERWQTIGPLVDNIAKLGGRLPASMQGYIDKLSEAKLLSSDNLDILRNLTGEGEVDWQRLQSVAEQYGIALEGLGGAFQAAKLSAGAQQLWDDFQLLIGAGADTDTVLRGMSDEISTLVQNSMAFGLAIPDNFRILIEKLRDSGQLLDAQGEKMTDLSKLKWTDTIQTSVERLVLKLEEFLDTLLKVPDAISRIPRSIDIDMGIRRSDTGSIDQASLAIGSEGTPSNVVPFRSSQFHPVTTIITKTYLNGRQIAESIAPELGSVVRRHVG